MNLTTKLNKYKENKLNKRKEQKRRAYHKAVSKDGPALSDTKEACTKRKYRERKRQSVKKERERKRKWRTANRANMEEDRSPTSLANKFVHRSTKIRAIDRIKKALPKSPNKRVLALKSYLSTRSPTVKKTLGTILSSTKSDKEFYENVVDDIKTVVKSVKNKRSKDALATMQVIVASVSGENITRTKCVKRLSDELELPVKRVIGGKQIRTKVLRSEKSCWSFTQRKTRHDSVPDTLKHKIYDFWTLPGISRPTGNKSDMKRSRLGPKVYACHMVHVLEKTQTEVYKSFKKQNPEIKISQIQFEKYRPFYVRAVREKDRNTCMCRYHVEMRILFRHIQTYRSSLIENGKINNPSIEFDCLSDVIDSTLCNMKSKDCFDRNCKNCGVRQLKSQIVPEELDQSDAAPKVIWERFDYQPITSNGKTFRILTLVKKTTSPGELYEYFLDEMETFPAHQYRSFWQQEQFRSLCENMALDDCVVVHDFSENYRCIDKEELQTSYFKRTEVTVHVSVIHRHSVLELDGIESTLENPKIVTENLYVISPDTTHDNQFVKKVQQVIAQYLQKISYPKVNTMHEYTDGCPAQYKSRQCVNDLATAASELGYRRLIRNYYETSHAKGKSVAFLS